MTEAARLAKKKVVVLLGSLSMFVVCSTTLPLMAVRHGIPAVWVVLPLVTLELVTMIYLLLAVVAFQKLVKDTSGQG